MSFIFLFFSMFANSLNLWTDTISNSKFVCVVNKVFHKLVYLFLYWCWWCHDQHSSSPGIWATTRVLTWAWQGGCHSTWRWLTRFTCTLNITVSPTTSRRCCSVCSWGIRPPLLLPMSLATQSCPVGWNTCWWHCPTQDTHIPGRIAPELCIGLPVLSCQEATTSSAEMPCPVVVLQVPLIPQPGGMIGLAAVLQW